MYDKLKRKQFFGSNENAVFERRNSDNYALEHKFSLAKYIFYTFWKDNIFFQYILTVAPHNALELFERFG